MLILYMTSHIIPQKEWFVKSNLPRGAGFIAAARLRGLEIDDALAYANAVAAIKVTRPGARAVPTHEEVLAFLAARA